MGHSKVVVTTSGVTSRPEDFDPPGPRGRAPLARFRRGVPLPCERVLARRSAQWTALVVGLLGSVAVGIAGLVTGPLPWNHPQTWWFDLPLDGMSLPTRLAVFNVVFHAGLSTMTAA